MQDSDAAAASPLNPVPWFIWVLALPVAGVELYLSGTEVGLIAAPEGARQAMFARLAWFPDLLPQMLDSAQYPPQLWGRIFTYGLIHGSFVQTLFALVILLALGKFVGEIFRWWAVWAVMALASVAGAVAITYAPIGAQALFGAYPPIYGLIGAFTYVLWQEARVTGKSRVAAFSHDWPFVGRAGAFWSGGRRRQGLGGGSGRVCRGLRGQLWPKPGRLGASNDAGPRTLTPAQVFDRRSRARNSDIRKAPITLPATK